MMGYHRDGFTNATLRENEPRFYLLWIPDFLGTRVECVWAMRAKDTEEGWTGKRII